MQTTTIQNPALISGLPITITALTPAVPASSGFIVSAITFANKTATPCTVTVSIYNGTTDFYIAFATPLAANDTLVLGGDLLKVLLTTGFSIRALASIAATVDAHASYVLFA